MPGMLRAAEALSNGVDVQIRMLPQGGLPQAVILDDDPSVGSLLSFSCGLENSIE
jgi:hypothetical protein